MHYVVVDLPGEEHSVGRGQQVRNDTGKTKVKSLPGHFIESEGFLDDFLYANHFLADWTGLDNSNNTYHVALDTSHHVRVLLINATGLQSFD